MSAAPGPTRLGGLAVLLLIGLLLPPMTAQWWRRRRIQRLSAFGQLLCAEVVGVEAVAFSRAARGDRGGWLPFSWGRLVEVHYAFRARDGRRLQGRFCAGRAQSERFRAGRQLEIFVSREDPRENVPLLVSRWFYQLGGDLLHA